MGKISVFLLFVAIIGSQAIKQIVKDQATGEEVAKAESIEATFSPSHFSPIKDRLIIYYRASQLCSIHKLPVEKGHYTNTSTVLLTERKGCSYIKKARMAQLVGADALLVKNDEVTDGAMWAMLDDFWLTVDEGKGEQRKINIPTLMISKEKGDFIKKQLLEKNKNLTISLESVSDRSLQKAWVAYWWMWFFIFLAITVVGVFYFVVLYRRGNQIFLTIKVIILLVAISAGLTTLDFLLDHWNTKGMLTRFGSQVFNVVSIDCVVVMYMFITWLWYSLLEEKSLIKSGGILDLKLKHIAISITSYCIISLTRLSLIAGGISVRISLSVYNIYLSIFCIIIAFAFSISGWRLRSKLLEFFHHSKRVQKLTIMTVVATFGMVFTCFSLDLWAVAPDLFGVWSWWIYLSLWRSETAFFQVLVLYTFGPGRSKQSGSRSGDSNKDTQKDASGSDRHNYASRASSVRGSTGFQRDNSSVELIESQASYKSADTTSTDLP